MKYAKRIDNPDPTNPVHFNKIFYESVLGYRLTNVVADIVADLKTLSMSYCGVLVFNDTTLHIQSTSDPDQLVSDYMDVHNGRASTSMANPDEYIAAANYARRCKAEANAARLAIERYAAFTVIRSAAHSRPKAMALLMTAVADWLCAIEVDGYHEGRAAVAESLRHMGFVKDAYVNQIKGDEADKLPMSCYVIGQLLASLDDCTQPPQILRTWITDHELDSE